MSDRLKEIFRLESVKYLTHVSLMRLLKKYDTAEECRELDEEELKLAGICEQGIKNLRSAVFYDDAYFEQMEKLARMKNVRVLTCFDDGYPSNLKNIYDPPPYLFYQGQLSAKDDISIGVVGSRFISRSGMITVAKISRELALAGFVIVSGLAMGADTYAHGGALEAGKRTVAVLGSGIDKPVNMDSRGARRLMIEKGGAVLSPFRIGTEPTVYTFPARNRIISGISLGVLIGEAKKKSGSLITANFALEQGKEVFALPNEIYHYKFEGSNNLIKTGQAKLVMGIEDIIDEMPEFVVNMISPSRISSEKKAVSFNDQAEENIYTALMKNKMNIDELSENLNMDTGTLMGKLFMLEMNKLITREPNNTFAVKRI